MASVAFVHLQRLPGMESSVFNRSRRREDHSRDDLTLVVIGHGLLSVLSEEPEAHMIRGPTQWEIDLRRLTQCQLQGSTNPVVKIRGFLSIRGFENEAQRHHRCRQNMVRLMTTTHHLVTTILLQQASLAGLFLDA